MKEVVSLIYSAAARRNCNDMTLQDQCVSLELAKRMKGLGWDKRTLFSWFKFVHKEKEDDGDWTLQIEGRDFWGSGSLPNFIHEGFLAPTVAELGEALQEAFDPFQSSHRSSLVPIFHGDGYAWYQNGEVTIRGSTEAEARGLLWCWLKEKKTI